MFAGVLVGGSVSSSASAAGLSWSGGRMTGVAIELSAGRAVAGGGSASVAGVTTMAGAAEVGEAFWRL